MQNNRWFFSKLNIELPYDPADPILGLITKRIESRCSNKNSYTNARSSAIHNTTCLSVDEWINKTCYIHTIDYNYSTIKRNGVLIQMHNTDEPQKHFARWKLSEARHEELHTVEFHSCERSRISKSIKTERKLVFSRVWE